MLKKEYQHKQIYGLMMDGWMDFIKFEWTGSNQFLVLDDFEVFQIHLV